MNDYLREIDLNPPVALGGPINNPLDPRAMHYFGFAGPANGQEIALVPAAASRVYVSFHYGNQPPGPPAPQPPVDAIVDFAAGGPPVLRYEENHDRRHVLVWLDPAGPTPTGPVMVRVKAWAKE